MSIPYMILWRTAPSMASWMNIAARAGSEALNTPASMPAWMLSVAISQTLVSDSLRMPCVSGEDGIWK